MDRYVLVQRMPEFRYAGIDLFPVFVGQRLFGRREEDGFLRRHVASFAIEELTGNGDECGARHVLAQQHIDDGAGEAVEAIVDLVVRPPDRPW